MINKRFTPVSRCAFAAVVAIVLLTVMAACARMGQPDGGWYDETPPRILSASPADKSVNVSSKKIYINFDEYIQIENAQEKVIVSPPQMEQPDIKSQGKRIMVQLRDTLQPNVTYTVDFSDAITDITENNPLGNYTYSFSTGEAIDTMEKDHIRLRFFGDMSALSPELQALAHRTDDISTHYDGFQANICLNYGGRAELLRAAQRCAERGLDWTEENLSANMYSAGIPDPELVIRPGGEMRLSNFLLWQCAYSELYFCDTLWPDFTRQELDKAIIDYQRRDRRFGGVK